MKRLLPFAVSTVLLLAHLPAAAGQSSGSSLGFDRNLYPGDARMAALRRQFAYTGFWLTPPPGAHTNSWTGKRKLLRDLGFGFIVLANGRLDAQIRGAQSKAGQSPDALARADAAVALASAEREGFPHGTILFLDQEEGGRMLPEQAAYLTGWVDAVSHSPFRPGIYLSGQPVPDGTGPDGKPQTITSAADVQARVKAGTMRPVALWVQQDACPPAPGCVAKAPAMALSGTPGAVLWQFAQSPRRVAITRSCAATYGADNNCYAGASSDLVLDLNAADSPDPSHGR